MNLSDLPFPVLVFIGGVVLAGLFFGAWFIRKRLHRRQPSMKSTVKDVPLFGKPQAISEKVVSAKREAEIVAEEMLSAQDTLVSLEARQATVEAVLTATKGLAGKN